MCPIDSDTYVYFCLLRKAPLPRAIVGFDPLRLRRARHHPLRFWMEVDECRICEHSFLFLKLKKNKIVPTSNLFSLEIYLEWYEIWFKKFCMFVCASFYLFVLEIYSLWSCGSDEGNTQRCRVLLNMTIDRFLSIARHTNDKRYGGNVAHCGGHVCITRSMSLVLTTRTTSRGNVTGHARFSMTH